MKKLLAILILALVLTLAIRAETLSSTKIRGTCSDPWLFTHDDRFYLARTGATRVAVHKASTLAGLMTSETEKSIAYNAASDPTVEVLYGEGATINGTWSPEIHYFSEEDFPGNSGWYMFLALRRTPEEGSAYTSEYLRMVVLKSTTGEPEGPYGHPKTGVANHSQPVITAEGEYYEEWACGQSVLRISEGEYAGIYALWVDEVGRGTSNFYQRIRISKLENPWTLTGNAGIVTTPTQDWEFRGSEDGFHPAVVEGGTAVYGKNGEVYLTYSGSGYQSAYGLGQITWNGGDPLETSSWVKYANNPIFSSATAKNLIGAGHASFLTDESGNGFFCYHAYPAENGEKTEGRHSYLERYSIDYTANNGVAGGVLRLGNGVPASFETSVTFDTDGEALKTPTVYALGRSFSITLNIPDSNAEGFIIYRSTDGKVFDYLTTTEATQYTDLDVTIGETYYYRVYPYRNEEIGSASEIASATASTCSPYTESATANGCTITVTVHAQDNYETVRLYRSEDGTHFGTGIQEINDVQYGETVTFTDTVTAAGTYEYMATGINGGLEYFPAGTVSVTVEITPPTITNLKQTLTGRVRIEVTAGEDYDGINVYHSADGETYTLRTLSSLQKEISAGGRLSTSVTRLEAGTHYFYATGVVSGVESKPSETVSFDVIEVKEPVVTVTTSCEAITLTWSGDEEYDSYTVFRGVLTTDEAIGEYYEYTEIADTAETTYTLSDITVGEEYYLGVRGTAGGIDSAISMAPIQTPAHTAVEAEALAPTCAAAGHTAYSYCSVCGADIVAKETVPATGHNHVLTEEEVPATTESEGKTAVYACSVCGDSYGGEVIPMLREPGDGDANGDGKLSLTDTLRILRRIANTTVEIDAEGADKNGDGSITIADALLTLKAILNGTV